MINQLLKDLRATTKSQEKIQLLKSFKNKALLHKVLLYCYDTVTYSYGIKKIPDENKGSIFGLDAQKLEVSSLISLLDRLVDRTYTGNDAVEYLDYVFNSAKISGYYDLMKCIVSRDLNAGINEGIIKKIFPDIIKKPKVQLISAFDQDKINQKIKFPAFAQLKVDGARAILIKNGSDIKILTRAGNEYTGLDSIKNELKHIPESFVLDGEIIYSPNHSLENMSSEDRQISNGIVNKSIQGTISEEESNKLKYIVWDLICINEYQNENKETLYFERFNKLDDIVNNKNIFKVDSYKINSLQEAKDIYSKYRSAGYEGIILKNLSMKWEDKRSLEAFKFKDEFDVDLRIIGYEPHSKKPNLIGSILVSSDDGKIKLSVGSGFKDSGSDDIMDRFGAYKSALNGDLIGKIVTIKCNSLIKSKDSDSYSLFLPRLICYRYDKNETNLLEDFL